LRLFFFRRGVSAGFLIDKSGPVVKPVKSFVMSPFIEERHMQDLIECLEKARRTVNY